MRIYCKNINCNWFRFLEDPIRFHYRKGYYIPFEEGYCPGECRKMPFLSSVDTETKNVIYKYAVCQDEKENKCQRRDCLWNENESCVRDEILVDKTKDGIWICRCFSQERISGHMDFSRFPQFVDEDGMKDARRRKLY